MHRVSRLRLFACSAIIALLSVGHAAAQDDTSDILAEVIVTAQRKPSSLLETPAAVSAFGGDALEARQVNDLRDLKTLVPGMQLGDSYGTAAITIRGVGTVEVLQGADPGVAYHVDGVYLGRSHLAAAAFFDVGQVEILRGPQGTLFGRNSTGGTVNFIPNKPTREFEAQAKLGVEADPFAYEAEAVVSGPISDKVLVRIGAQRLYNEGFAENLNSAGPDRLDDRDSWALRGQLTFLVSDDLEANLLVEHYDAGSNGSAQYFVGTPSGAPAPAELQGGLRPNLQDRKLHANYGVSDLSYTGAILKVTWDGPLGRLTSTSAYHEADSRFLSDFDGTQVDFTSTDISNASEQAYQELILVTEMGDRVDLVLGANAFWEQSGQTVQVPINFPGSPLTVDIASEIETRSYAGFGHLTVNLTEALEAFGGARYTHDKKEAVRANNFVGQGRAEVDWDAVTYELGASYKLAERTNVYAKHSKGYKGGGFESSGPAAPPFDPEYNKSWEVGLKGQYFDRRMQLAVSAFHNRYSDLQVNQIVGVSNTVTNAASATIKGLEIEVAARPTSALTLEAAFSFLDAEFDEFVTADGARPNLGQLDLSGNRLRSSPEFTANLGAAYTYALGAAGNMTVSGRWYWQDRMYFSEFNLPLSSQDPVGRADVSIDFVSSDNAWRASGFVTNVADKTVRNDVVVVSDLLGSAAFAKLDAGRRIGVSIARRF